MKKKRFSIAELTRRKIACIGIGEDFYNFFNSFSGSILIPNIILCVDNNTSNQGNAICVGDGSMIIESPRKLVETLSEEYILMVMSSSYTTEIVEGLSLLDGLENLEYVTIYDYYHGESLVKDIHKIIEKNKGLKNIIPKTIHWCWFGENAMPEKEKVCLSTWKEYCSDYDVVRWDEHSFDVYSVPYVREAYEAKKWAFITDYVRLWAIYKYGGIYMDADVEVVKPLDVFLCEHAFSGFEDNARIPTGIMGGEKNSKYMEYLLSYYDGRHFLTDSGYDLTTNVFTITDMTYRKYNVRPETDFLRVDGEFTMYPREVFCPINYMTGEIGQTENTYAIHRFSGSWC